MMIKFVCHLTVWAALWMVACILVVGVAAGCSGERSFVQRSRSMLPTISPGDHVHVVPVLSQNASLERWDVIVFKSPLSTNGWFVMRVVGLPGEALMLDGSGLTIDGVRQETPEYLHPVVFRSHPKQVHALKRPFGISENHVFVLGDNPSVANDSRFWGELDVSQVVGKVVRIAAADITNSGNGIGPNIKIGRDGK